MRSARSNSVTSCPARASCWAPAIPAGPLPTTATRRPVRARAGRGSTQDSSNARSAIDFSSSLIDTGSSLTFNVQACSHGAGQTRPVISGKLLVAWSRSIASAQSPR